MTTQTQHTPGPWTVGSKGSDEKYGIPYINIAGADDHHVSKITSRKEEENEANARLIAAAIASAEGRP